MLFKYDIKSQKLNCQRTQPPMFDSDESYLLQSYNQNQPLFANVSLSRQMKKSTKVYQQYCSNQIKGKFKDRGYGETGAQIEGKEYGRREEDMGVIGVPMLNSIDEDQREYDKSACKFQSGLKDPKLRANSTSHCRQNKPNQGTKFKYPSKPSTDLIFKTQHIQPHPQLHPQPHPHPQLTPQLQSLESLFKKSTTETQRKLTQLQKLLTHFYTKYSELVQKLEVYEELVDKQAKVIQEQQYVIGEWGLLWEAVARKINNGNNGYGNGEEQASIGGIGVDVGVVTRRIVSIIRDKVGGGIFHQEYNDHRQNNLATQAINSTKSVPILVSCQKHQPNQSGSQLYGKKDIVQYQSPYKQYESQNLQYQSTKPNNTNISQTIPKQPQPYSHSHSNPYPYPWQDPPIPSPCPQPTQTYRKITNLRIKQLQAENTTLQNQLHSCNIKLMVMRQENKELREIVEGLIMEVRKMNQGRRVGGV